MLTEAEIVQVLAMRVGQCIHDYEHKVIVDGHTPESFWKCKKCGKEAYYMKLEQYPDYINSLDALWPVLVKLTAEEMDALFLKLVASHRCASAMWVCRYVLTLPASTLARLIAEVIVECKAKEAA